MVNCLISPGYFCCFCTISPASIEAGLFIRKELADEEAIAQLYDPYEKVTYSAIVPASRNYVSSNFVLLRNYASI